MSNRLTIQNGAIVSGSLNVSGSIIPAVDGISTTSSFSLGSATNAWKDIFVSNGTINFLDGTGNVQAALSSTDQGLQIQNYPADTGSIPVFNVSGSGTFTDGLTITGSLVQGLGTQASGSYSHAEGYQTIASGSYSHAEGAYTQAIGEYSHAEGSSTKTGTQNAYYAQSVVNGVITLSGSYGDVASSFATDNRLYLYDTPFDAAYNRTTFIISQSYFDSTNTIVELYDTSVNTTTAYVGDLGQGVNNWTGDQIIPGDYSHTEGFSTQAVGDISHAEGQSTQAIGQGSHAEGGETKAIGSISHAEGANTQAIGIASHAEGDYAQAIGGGSHAEGRRTQTIGNYSHAEGHYTIASGSYQHVSGQYNQHNNDTSYFVVGIGLTEETRKDGFTVDVDANGSGSVMIPNNLDAPSVAKTGSMYVDPANNKLWIYTGNGGVGGWVTASLG